MAGVQLPPWEMRPLALERYSRLGAQTFGDGPAGWYLAGLVEAWAAPYDDLEHVARVAPDGRDGWQVAADPAVCRRAFLPWAAQFFGESVPVEDVAPGVPESVVAGHRERVLERPTRSLGSTAAIVQAYRSRMTGNGLIVRDRYNPAAPGTDAPYHLSLVARAAQVPDPAAALRAAQAAKPAWVQLHVEVSDVRDWQEVLDTYEDWQDVLDNNADWQDVLTP